MNGNVNGIVNGNVNGNVNVNVNVHKLEEALDEFDTRYLESYQQITAKMALLALGAPPPPLLLLPLLRAAAASLVAASAAFSASPAAPAAHEAPVASNGPEGPGRPVLAAVDERPAPVAVAVAAPHGSAIGATQKHRPARATVGPGSHFLQKRVLAFHHHRHWCPSSSGKETFATRYRAVLLGARLHWLS